MIPLTTIEYDTEASIEEILSRLSWSVERVESSWQDYMSWSTSPATNKDWVGQIDDEELTFDLEEPGHFFKRKLNITVSGRIIDHRYSRTIKLKLGLDFFSALLTLLIFIGTAFMIGQVINSENFDSYFSLGFWILVYPGLTFYLIRRRILRAESKLDFLFDEAIRPITSHK